LPSTPLGNIRTTDSLTDIRATNALTIGPQLGPRITTGSYTAAPISNWTTSSTTMAYPSSPRVGRTTGSFTAFPPSSWTTGAGSYTAAQPSTPRTLTTGTLNASQPSGSFTAAPPQSNSRFVLVNQSSSAIRAPSVGLDQFLVGSPGPSRNCRGRSVDRSMSPQRLSRATSASIRSGAASAAVSLSYVPQVNASLVPARSPAKGSTTPRQVSLPVVLAQVKQTEPQMVTIDAESMSPHSKIKMLTTEMHAMPGVRVENLAAPSPYTLVATEKGIAAIKLNL